MNVWSLDEPVVSRPRVKKASFADVEVEATSTSGWGADSQSQRRKQRGKVEFLVDDQQGSGDEDDERDNSKTLDSNGAPELTSAKTNEVISADVVLSVDSESRDAEPTQTYDATREQKSTASNQEVTVHYLVREFLLMHCHDDVVKILDQDRPMPLLGDAEIKDLNQRLAGRNESRANPTAPYSLLERFLVCSNEAKIKARAKRSSKDRSASAEKKTRVKESSSGRRKPVLNVITSNLDQRADTITNATPLNSQASGDYNRLNHPGSTPHHQPHETVLGEPGSTPMARAKDLRALGYEDIDEDGNKFASDQSPRVDQAGDNADQLSEYALRKRASRSGPKHVQLGNPGSTPTKEYIFFRETPPSFVTETIEEAVEVFEKLGSDPEFVKQAAVVERYVELQSSEVSKYTVGQAVNGLGAQSNISGVVSKIYGSRLCGTAGPGTIVIDTCPEEPLANNA